MKRLKFLIPHCLQTIFCVEVYEVYEVYDLDNVFYQIVLKKKLMYIINIYRNTTHLIGTPYLEYKILLK